MRSFALVLAAACPLAAQPGDRGSQRIEIELRREILRLPFYGVYDWISVQASGRAITLSGAVTRPSLKSGAEAASKRIEGVEKVVNLIEVLPVSPSDDRIRSAVLASILRHPAMTRYAIRGPNSPIHIVVKNGKVELLGAVSSELDKTIAGTQAGGVPGTLGVKNSLTLDSRAN